MRHKVAAFFIIKFTSMTYFLGCKNVLKPSFLFLASGLYEVSSIFSSSVCSIAYSKSSTEISALCLFRALSEAMSQIMLMLWQEYPSSAFAIFKTAESSFSSFLPFADPVSVKVYIYGLYKCSSPTSFDNNIESFAKALNMSEEDVIGAFEYWQEQGLVQVLKTSPIEIRYIPLKNVINATKLFKPDKYQTFNMQAQEIFEGKREISKTEYGEYYEFMARYH